MKSTHQSEREYNEIFGSDDREVALDEKEYYEVLGTLLKGKKSVDLGCGHGFIEHFSPETVGVDFSEEALASARKKGIKSLVKADVQNLPFENNEFEVAVSSGVLEHIENMDKAISEMIRVSHMQILIVHAKLPFGLELIRKPLLKLAGLKDQPIEKPQSMRAIRKMVHRNGAKIVFEGLWNYVDLRWLNKNIPYGIVKWPSHHLIVSIKTANVDRKFMGQPSST